MDELTIGDKVYISSKRAAKITGYAKDYVGQLCREGRVEARLVGRNWYVLESSINEHRFGAPEVKNDPGEGSKAPETADKPYSWSNPTYIAETPVQIPSLPSKQQEPEVVASRKVVSEMQAAWQEWFTQQGTQALTEETAAIEEPSEVPDRTEQADEDFEPAREAAPEELGAPIELVTYEDEVEAPAPFAAMTEVMDLSRGATHKDLLTTSEQVMEEYPQYEATTPGRRGASSAVAKSLLIGVAFIALCVALVGTGLLGDLLRDANGSNQLLVNVAKYLGGESEYVNSK